MGDDEEEDEEDEDEDEEDEGDEEEDDEEEEEEEQEEKSDAKEQVRKEEHQVKLDTQGTCRCMLQNLTTIKWLKHNLLLHDNDYI